MRPPSSVVLVLLLLVGLPTCADVPRSERSPDTLAGSTDAPEPGNFRGRIYERTLVFLSPASDTLLLVPWLVSARTRPDGVERRARGLLGRSGSWEPFMDERWTGPATRAPWRILPHGGMRLVVGPGDALERIVFEEGARLLELAPGGVLAEWTGQRGEAVRLTSADLVLGGRGVPGLLLDLSRTRPADDPPPGDWTVLASGDSLRVFLHQPVAVDGDPTGSWRGWALVNFREPRFPAATVEWVETRAFERARRDVPVRWRIRGEERALDGTLEAVGIHLEAEEGEGPQLPVDGLFHVEGSLLLDGSDYPVRGLYRHVQR